MKNWPKIRVLKPELVKCVFLSAPSLKSMGGEGFLTVCSEALIMKVVFSNFLGVTRVTCRVPFTWLALSSCRRDENHAW